jgi:predicted MFS family arabinose efflux permease
MSVPEGGQYMTQAETAAGPEPAAGADQAMAGQQEPFPVDGGANPLGSGVNPADGANPAHGLNPAGGANPAGRNAYLALLRLPGAARFSVAAALGRTPMAMFGLGTVLLVKATTGQYGLAGTVAGAGSIGYAISAPRLGRLADRLGQGHVLRPLVLFFAISTVTFITCAELRAPIWALLITGGLAGASMPSLGSMVRARWSALLTGSPALHSAFALESVADEMIFVAGPAVVTLLATRVLPAAGVVVAMVVCVTGTLLFASQRRTEPPPRPAGPGGRRGRSLAAPALATLAPAYLCLGAMFAAIDLSTIDFAQQQGYKPLAGFILGTYALGSAIGGLWYGSRTWRVPLERRFAITLILTVAGVATFWAQPSLVTLDLTMLCAGLTISPTLIAGYSIIEQQATELRRTEAMTWLSSTISVGVAIGSAAAGHLVDSAGPRLGYGFAAVCGGAAVAVCLVGQRVLRATGDAPAAQWADAKS